MLNERSHYYITDRVIHGYGHSITWNNMANQSLAKRNEKWRRGRSTSVRWTTLCVYVANWLYPSIYIYCISMTQYISHDKI